MILLLIAILAVTVATLLIVAKLAQGLLALKSSIEQSSVGGLLGIGS